MAEVCGMMFTHQFIFVASLTLTFSLIQNNLLVHFIPHQIDPGQGTIFFFWM